MRNSHHTTCDLSEPAGRERGKTRRKREREMQNESGEVVDTYIPRKCSASGRIIGAKDHASVQICIAEVDEKTGRMSGGVRHVAISGFIRGMGESDDCLNRLCTEAGILSGVSDQHGMSECMNVYVYSLLSRVHSI